MPLRTSFHGSFPSVRSLSTHVAVRASSSRLPPPTLPACGPRLGLRNKGLHCNLAWTVPHSPFMASEGAGSRAAGCIQQAQHQKARS